LNEGARSSLPQYLQTNLPALDVARVDRRDGCAAFFVFEACAPFGLAATPFFFAGANLPSTGDGLGGSPPLKPLLFAIIPVACLVSISNVTPFRAKA
jgi:hypothetical protein